MVLKAVKVSQAVACTMIDVLWRWCAGVKMSEGNCEESGTSPLQPEMTVAARTEQAWLATRPRLETAGTEKGLAIKEIVVEKTERQSRWISTR